MPQHEPFLGKLHQYVPGIPKPAEKENPVTEQLTQAHFVPDHRPQAEKPRVHNLIPRYNTLYGTDRVEGSWRSLIDHRAFGTFTTAGSGAALRVAVTLVNDPQWRLEQWPGAVNLFLCIRQFSVGVNLTAPAVTLGSILCNFEDPAGKTVPLGMFISNTAFNQDDIDMLIPTPITDPNNKNVGTLIFQIAGAGITSTNYSYQMAFSGAYMIPQLVAGYEEEVGIPHYDERLHTYHH